MPYIKNENGRREELDDGAIAQTAGELNYQIFSHVKQRQENGLKACNHSAVKLYVAKFLGETPNYQKYNDMVGCLILCQKEIKRRLNVDLKYLTIIINFYFPLIYKYEDEKIIENGDVI